MSFLLTDDLVQFEQVLRRWCDEHASIEWLRTKVPLPDAAVEPLAVTLSAEERTRLWSGLAELGVFAAGLPESAGGLELGIAATRLIVEICAYQLLPLPVFETLALGAARISSLEASARTTELLEQVGNGTLSLSGALEANAGRLEVRTTKKGTTLSGTLELVPSAREVDALVVQGSNGVSYLVGRGAFHEQPTSTLDLVRPFYRVTFDKAVAEPLGAANEGSVSNLSQYLLV
ncbi:MAG: acyl-CoA dehydrogenase family protein, partial [Bdellovibrionales bacterium]|nr:acyl-CoA dehydrogenase family protein [Bdellovibrionales bacterium]